MAVRLVELSIEGFKTIERLEFEPRQLNVLVGANGAGSGAGGEALVVSPRGELFRGAATALQPGANHTVMPDYRALRKVE